MIEEWLSNDLYYIKGTKGDCIVQQTFPYDEKTFEMKRLMTISQIKDLLNNN